ncbi:MAG TPA: M20/M25/M40 family metallo-hydrolase [Chloroflexota bacterium]|jgi:acetylornithine deacetylase/succinyl-diaminopimelate desuccinylase-like protein
MAGSPAERALAAIGEERVVGLLRRLVDTPSPTGDERACAETLADHLRGVGVPADVQPFGGSRANVLARAPGRGDGVRLMYCGHLDTGGYGDPALDYALHGLRLGPADQPRSFVADGVVYGLGAYNMKGGVAAAAEALTALVESGAALAGDVLLGGVAGESEKAPVRGALGDWTGARFEGGGVGADWMLQHSARPDAAVICEPSDCCVVNGQPGYLAVKVALHGRSAYMASKGPNDPGLSAIELAYGVVQAVREWEPRYREQYALECGMGTMYSPVTVGAIEGGWPFKPGHAPGVCNVYIDLRVPPQLDPRDALAELEAVVRAGVDTSRGGSHALEVFASNVPGALTPFDHPLMQAGLRARSTALGSAQERYPDEDLVPGDDGKVFARVGIPYVKCGPAGQPMAGQKRLGREAIPIQQLVEAARLYVLLALDVANRPRTELATWPAVKTAPAHFA